jgi:hypothetical protein
MIRWVKWLLAGATVVSTTGLSPALAVVPAARVCNDTAMVIRLLDEVEAFVPNVPPANVAYFEKNCAPPRLSTQFSELRH